MSKCISAQGEYSEHTPGVEEFVCAYCFVLDEDAIRFEVGRLRAETHQARTEVRLLESQARDADAAIWDFRDALNRVRQYCDGVVRTHVDHGGSVESATVARSVLNLIYLIYVEPEWIRQIADAEATYRKRNQ